MVSIKNITAGQRWIPNLIVLFTAIFRVFELGMKPPHFDEGVNGWFIDQMYTKGHHYYHYDPANYHGPLHFYILFTFLTLLGRHIWAMRLPLVIISTLTVWLITKFDRFLDRRTCWIAAAAMAVSPAMEFYSRYAIHESEFVFFLVLVVWGAAGILRFGTMPYLWAAALGFTGLILTKETYIIHITSFLLALLCLWALERFSPSSNAPPLPPGGYTLPQIGTVAVICILLIVFFYSGTFMDFSALQGLYTTFGEWAKTGNAGNGHEKADFNIAFPFYHLVFDKGIHLQPGRLVIFNYYWLCLASVFEWPALIGMVAGLLVVWPLKDRLIRFLAIYGWGALVAYSIVHYKTPWCIITIIWPFFFVFGEAVKGLLSLVSKITVPMQAKALGGIAAALLLLSIPASFARSVMLNFKHYVDDETPYGYYVYVQTYKDIDRITGPLFDLVKENSENYAMKGNILLTSYHPLPWVLGDFTGIGWYDDNRKPDEMDADFLLVEKSRLREVEKALKHRYFLETVKLRNSMDPAQLYLDYDKFRHLYPDRQPEFTPGTLSPSAQAAIEDEDNSDSNGDPDNSSPASSSPATSGSPANTPAGNSPEEMQ